VVAGILAAASLIQVSLTPAPLRQQVLASVIAVATCATVAFRQRYPATAGVTAQGLIALDFLESEPDTTVTGEASDGRDAVAAARRLRPNTTDLRLSGLQRCLDLRFLCAACGDLPVAGAPGRRLGV
jgi:hypothetical protein